MRAISYLRVSSEAQKERNTIAAQRLAITEYAESNNISIIKEFKDEAYSGTNSERPGLLDMVEYFKTGRAETLLVYDIDRLGRLDENPAARDTVNWVRYEAELSGVEIIFLRTPATGDPILDMGMRELKRLFSGMERLMIKQRMRQGKLAKARAGLIVTGSSAPYGYFYKDRAFHIDKEEARVVKLIFEEYLQPGASTNTITGSLIEWGFPTKRGAVFKQGISKGKPRWHRLTVQRVLRNGTYTGVFYQNRYGGKKVRNTKGVTVNKRFERPQEEWIAIQVPTIIEKSVFEAAQEKLTDNRTFSRRSAKRVYPYSGLLRCGKCGLRYHSSYDDRFKNTYIYYRCGSHNTPGRTKCGNPTVSEKKLDKHIYKYIQRHIEDVLDPNYFEKIFYGTDNKHESIYNTTKKRVIWLDKKLQGIQKQEENLLIELTKERFSEDIIEKRLSEIEESKGGTQKQLKQATKELVELEKNKGLKNSLLKIAEEVIPDVIEEAKAGYRYSPEIKKRVLRRFVKEIEIHENRLVLNGEMVFDISDKLSNAEVSEGSPIERVRIPIFAVLENWY